MSGTRTNYSNEWRTRLLTQIIRHITHHQALLAVCAPKTLGTFVTHYLGILNAEREHTGCSCFFFRFKIPESITAVSIR